eukprot:4897133-Amphidinium_carterae.1
MEKYPVASYTTGTFLRPKYTGFHIQRSSPEPRPASLLGKASSGDVEDEGRSASSSGDPRRPLRIV